MLKPREADIPALFMVLVVLSVIIYIILGKWNDTSKKVAKADILAHITAEESFREEEVMAAADVLPVVPLWRIDTHVCAKCYAPATSRCSRCKFVGYCSEKCQIVHWRQGHKQECQQWQNGVVNFSAGLAPITDSIRRGSMIEGSRDFTPYILDPDKSAARAPRQCQPHVTIQKCFIDDESRILPSVPASSHEQSFKGIINMKEMTLETSSSSKNPKSRLVGLINGYKRNKVLFPYEDIVKLFQCEVLGISPRGLLNCGNSCYANAVFQCLTFTKPIMAYLLHGSHSRTCRITDWCLMCELKQHIAELLEGGGPLSPSKILLNMSVGYRMGGGYQEDAHEFLRSQIFRRGKGIIGAADMKSRMLKKFVGVSWIVLKGPTFQI